MLHVVRIYVAFLKRYYVKKKDNTEKIIFRTLFPHHRCILGFYGRLFNGTSSFALCLSLVQLTYFLSFFNNRSMVFFLYFLRLLFAFDRKGRHSRFLQGKSFNISRTYLEKFALNKDFSAFPSIFFTFQFWFSNDKTS